MTNPVSHVSAVPPSGSTPQSTVAAVTFEQLLAHVLDPAYGLALRYTGNKSDAEDLVQDAAYRAFRGFHSFQAGTNFKAWFFRILTNRFFEKHRQRKREPAPVDLDDTPDLYLYARSIESGLPYQGTDPAAELMNKLGTERVGVALDQLPDEYRAACVLYFTEELGYEEIAAILGCPLGTVRSRLHRGRKMLQKLLWHVAVEDGLVRGGPRAEASQ